MLYPELNGLIGLFPEYKRLILPKIRAVVKANPVRSESFFGSFFVFGHKTGRRFSKRRPFFSFQSVSERTTSTTSSRLSPSAIRRKPTPLQVNSAW